MAWNYESIEPDIIHLAIQNREFAVNVLLELENEYFENETCRHMLKVIKDHYLENKTIPKYKYFRTMAQKKMPKAFDMEEARRIYEDIELTPGEIDFIKDRIPNFVRLSRFKDFIDSASFKISQIDEVDDLDEIFQESKEELQNIIRFNMDKDLGTNIYSVDARYAALTDRQHGAIMPMLKNLGQHIGGFKKKELYTYIGAPGAGKSVFLAQDAWAATMQGFDTVLITLEMSEEMFGARIDQSITKKKFKELIEMDKKVMDALKKAYANSKRAGAGQLYIKEFAAGQASILHIDQYLDMLEIYNDFRPDFLVVDYGDILKPNGKVTGDRYKDQAKSFLDLRGYAKEKEIPVLTAAQINREYNDPTKKSKGPIDDNRLADSYDKLRTVDGMFSININYKTIEEDEDEEDLDEAEQILNEYEDREATNDSLEIEEYYIFIVKNRHGKKKIKIPFHMDYEYMKVTDLAEWEE